MARPKKYKTQEEREEAGRRRAMENYWKNREDILEKQKQTLMEMTPEEYAEHRNYMNNYMKIYRKDNRECLRQQSLKSRSKNREEYNRRNREKHAANPEVKRKKDREWCKNNPEKAKAKNAASRLNRRARGGRKLRVAEVLSIKQQHGDICFYCKNNGATDIEHKTPICRGGTNELDNLCMSCKLCNGRKFKMTAEEFIERGVKEGFLKREDHPVK
jgi:hypothetical protein